MPKFLKESLIINITLLSVIVFLFFVLPVNALDVNSVYFEDNEDETIIANDVKFKSTTESIITKMPVISSIYLDDATVKKGYTTKSNDEKFASSK
jgi:hypothetical protein